MNFKVDGEIVRSAIVSSLSGSFGDQYCYYKEDVTQDGETNCFIVHQVNATFELVRNLTYRINFLMNVTFFPDEQELTPEEISVNVGNKMLESLNVIKLKSNYSQDDSGVTITKRVRAKNMNYAINDGACVFTANYTFLVDLEKEQDAMMMVLQQENKEE